MRVCGKTRYKVVVAKWRVTRSILGRLLQQKSEPKGKDEYYRQGMAIREV